MSDSTISPPPVPSYNSPDPARKPQARADTTEIYINSYEHPNATVIKIEIIGWDADKRALVEKAIRMSFSAVLERDDSGYEPIPE